MASLEVTKKSLFRAVRDQVRSDHGLLIDRSDSLDDGPFLIKSPDGDKVILKGMTLQQLASLGHFDLTQFEASRERGRDPAPAGAGEPVAAEHLRRAGGQRDDRQPPQKSRPGSVAGAAGLSARRRRATGPKQLPASEEVRKGLSR